MQVTGRQAQLGRGLMEDVAGAILGDFAGRLERELRGEGADRPSAPARRSTSARPCAAPLLERAGLVLAGLVAGLALGRVVWRR